MWVLLLGHARQERWKWSGCVDRQSQEAALTDETRVTEEKRVGVQYSLLQPLKDGRTRVATEEAEAH